MFTNICAKMTFIQSSPVGTSAPREEDVVHEVQYMQLGHKVRQLLHALQHHGGHATGMQVARQEPGTACFDGILKGAGKP